MTERRQVGALWILVATNAAACAGLRKTSREVEIRLSDGRLTITPIGYAGRTRQTLEPTVVEHPADDAPAVAWLVRQAAALLSDA